MTQDHATPVPRRAFTIVRASTEAGPAPVPPVPVLVPASGTDGADGPAAVPVPVVATVPMSVPERARLAVARQAGTAAGIAGRLWLAPGRLIHVLRNPQPETMAEYRAYIRSRAWVPRELSGKSATAIAWAGIAYHVLIGHPLVAAMKAVRKTAENIEVAAVRPLRLLMLAAFVTVLVLILLNL